jgi:flavodoxin I
MDQVIYYSKSGNTRKVADAIAEELGIKAVDVNAASLDPGAKVVFLGSGRYGGLPGPEMQKFIESNDFKSRKVAYFSTCWRAGLSKDREVESTNKALEKKGAIVLGDYHCLGKTKIFNGGHPNQEDLDGAKKFAREMAKLAL